MNANYVVAWEFTPNVGDESSFEAAYGPRGDWAQLFRRDPHYIRTELLRDIQNPRHYITLDYWTSQHAYDEFREQHADEYKRIDARFETLAESEELIGKFVTVDATPGGQ